MVIYPDTLSAINSAPHGPGVPVPSPPEKRELEEDVKVYKWKTLTYL